MINKDDTRVSCILLAGGEGRRLGGEDKGLIEIQGVPMIRKIIDALEPQVDEIIISANRNLDRYASLGHEVVSDDIEGFQGPLSGVRTSARHCRYGWILIAPCDIPYLPDDLVMRLMPIQGDACLVRVDGKDQLIFMIHSDLLDSLDRYLDDGHRRAMDWIRSLEPEIVELERVGQQFLNINTVSDIEQFDNGT